MSVYKDQEQYFWEHPGMDRIGPFATERDAEEDYLRYLALHETSNDPFAIAVECTKLAKFQRLAADYQELAKAAESKLEEINRLFRIEGIYWSVFGGWIVRPTHASFLENDDD